MSNSSIVAIIPARMDSSRFPGKPLALILGLPMIEHVYHRTALCQSLDAVYVATCDEEIRQAVEGFSGRAIMTSPEHQPASDRVAEAAQHLDADIVVMVQGDEPMTMPEMIDQAVAPMLDDPLVQCVNLVKQKEVVACVRRIIDQGKTFLNERREQWRQAVHKMLGPVTEDTYQLFMA